MEKRPQPTQRFRVRLPAGVQRVRRRPPVPVSSTPIAGAFVRVGLTLTLAAVMERYAKSYVRQQRRVTQTINNVVSAAAVQVEYRQHREKLCEEYLNDLVSVRRTFHAEYRRARRWQRYFVLAWMLSIPLVVLCPTMWPVVPALLGATLFSPVGHFPSDIRFRTAVSMLTQMQSWGTPSVRLRVRIELQRAARLAEVTTFGRPALKALVRLPEALREMKPHR